MTPPPQPPTPRRAGIVALLALLVLGLLTFWPALSAGFVNFDDDLYFGPNNPEFQREGLAAILDPRRTIANAYLPVSHLSLYFDWLLVQQGASPAWPHLHSLLLHVLAAFVLARLLGRLGLTRGPATTAAALFLVHPALAESVAWVSSRKDVLSGLFAFLCLDAVAAGARRPGVGRNAAAAAFALLAIYSKATAVVLPLFAPLVAWLAAGRVRWPAIAAVAVPVLAGAIHHTVIASAEGTLQAGAVGERLGRVPGSFLHYAATVFWPARLNVLHPEVLTFETFAASLLPGLLAVILVLALGVAALRRERTRGVGVAILLAVAAWLPFNTAWPGSAVAAADRYLYLVVPWVALLVVLGLCRIGGARLATVAAAALVVPLAITARHRSRDFQDSEQLWASSLAVEPHNAVARLNLAAAIVRRDPARARALADAAVGDARYPVHELRAYEWLRDLALAEGRLEEAQLRATQAQGTTAKLPHSPAGDARRILVALAAVRTHEVAGNGARARELFAELRRQVPDHPAVLVQAAAFALGAAMDEQGRIPPASPARQEIPRLLQAATSASGGADTDALLVQARFERACGNLMAAKRIYGDLRQRLPGHAEVCLGEADLCLEQNLYAEAQRVIETALAAGVRDPNLLARLEIALVGQGGESRLAAARERYEAYLETRPNDPAVRRLLARALVAQLRPKLTQDSSANLRAGAARVRELEPQNPWPDVFDAVVALRGRDLEAALVLLERAHDRLPEDADVTRLLAETHRDRGNWLLLHDDPRSERALEHLRSFLALAPAEVPTEAARATLQNGWLRLEAQGIAAFQRGEHQEAERCFRKCLLLVPEQRSVCFQLGLVLYTVGGQDDEALAQFTLAEQFQRQAGFDPSLAVQYQVQTLARLTRRDDAARKAREYLAETPARTGPVRERLERLLERLGN